MTENRTDSPPAGPSLGLTAALAKRLLAGSLKKLQQGSLTVTDSSGSLHFGAPAKDSAAPHVQVRIADPRAYREVAFHGSIGAGRAYMQGWLLCEQLTDLVRLFVINQQAMQNMERGAARLGRMLHRLFHLMRMNSMAGSRRNSAAHYDISDALYERFLDPTMVYSAGVFQRADDTMEQASINKMERICQKLNLQPGEHVLDLGGGWGGFVLYAAQNYGVHATMLTLSQAHYETARRRIREAGLQEQASVVLEDYRTHAGRYDKLVSIEMIEHVGLGRMGGFFSSCNRMLKPLGAMLLQAITISDELFPASRRSVDFIQRYIFPGGALPSLGFLQQHAVTAGNLRLAHMEDISAHYVKTLGLWWENLRENWRELRELGFKESFLRMWEFYLCYCQGGFAERSLADLQLLFTRPHAPLAGYVPPLPLALP